jgi:hypothetical protein
MWQINRITKDTLLNISKYSNKVIKIAQFIQETNQPFLINNLLSVSDQTDQVEILNAFDKDLNKTMNDFFEIQKLLVTVDDNGYVKELDNEEKNIKELFKDKYNIDTKTLSLPTLDLNLASPSTKETIRTSIIESVLGLDFKKYKELLKIKETLKDINKSDLATGNDKIRYLTNKTDIDFVKECVDKISVYTNAFVEIRKDLDFEEKDLIDSKITSGRTMVDGILPNSTYISKKEGIYQISTLHKKDFGDELPDLLDKVQELINESGYISGVEIDQDTDLEKFIYMLKKVKTLHLNVELEFELKTRKLGNYMANGQYYHDENIIELMGYHSDIYNIVSVDVNSPSSLIHELTHLIDLSNREFHNTPERRAMVSHFTEKLWLPAEIAINLSDDYVSNLYNNKEVIARLGEIGYLLNKVGYQGHKTPEELENYYKKIRMMEMMETAGDKEIPIVHGIDFYRKNNFMFFDIDNLKEEELLSIKEYYKSYYNVFEKEFIELNNSSILNNLKSNALKSDFKDEKTLEKRTNNRFVKEDFPISKVNIDNIDSLLEYNDQDEIFSNKELADFLSVNFVDINRTKMNQDSFHYAMAFKVIEKVFIHAINTGNKELEKEMFNTFSIKASSSYDRVGELNNSVTSEKINEYYKMNNTSFMDSNRGVMEAICKDILKNSQSLSTGQDPENSVINTRISPEFAIDRSIILEQVTNHLNFLNNFDENDIYLHKTLFDISTMFSRYSDHLDQIFTLENLEKKVNNLPEFNNEELIKFSDLLNATLILENDNKLSSFKQGVTRTIEYYHAGYSKRPSFDLKLEDLKEDFLLKNFDNFKNNMQEIPATMKKNKGFSDNATDKQKLSLLSKVSLKNFEQEFMINFVKNLDFQELKQDKKVEVFKDSADTIRYGFGKKERLFNNYLSDNSIGLDKEMSYAALREFSARYSVLKVDSIPVNESLLLEKSMQITLNKYIEIQKKEALESQSFLEDNKDTHLFLKSIQKEVMKFMLDKGIAEKYINYLKENNENTRGFRRINHTNKMIKNLFNLSSVNISQDNALELLKEKSSKSIKKPKFN